VSLRSLAFHHPLFRIHRANLASVPPRHPLLNRYGEEGTGLVDRTRISRQDALPRHEAACFLCPGRVLLGAVRVIRRSKLHLTLVQNVGQRVRKVSAVLAKEVQSLLLRVRGA